MKKIKDEYKIPLFLAVLLHIVILSVLFVRMKTPHALVIASQGAVIKAVSVDKMRVEHEMKRIMQKREREAQARLAKKRKLKQQMLTYQRKRRVEASRLKRLKKQTVLAKAQALKQKRLAEKARAQATVAEEKRERALQEEKTRVEKMHAAQALQKELAQEKLKWAQKKTLTKAQITALDRYKALILARISNNWLVPASANHKLSCQFLIHVAPDGTVLSIKLARSSGDAALDRSAQTAVMKSSPLPVPKEKNLFDQFRTLRLTVHPREV